MPSRVARIQDEKFIHKRERSKHAVECKQTIWKFFIFYATPNGGFELNFTGVDERIVCELWTQRRERTESNCEHKNIEWRHETSQFHSCVLKSECVVLPIYSCALGRYIFAFCICYQQHPFSAPSWRECWLCRWYFCESYKGGGEEIRKTVNWIEVEISSCRYIYRSKSIENMLSSWEIFFRFFFFLLRHFFFVIRAEMRNRNSREEEEKNFLQL